MDKLSLSSELPVVQNPFLQISEQNRWTPSSNIIENSVDQGLTAVVKKKEDPLQSLQELIDKVENLTRYPQFVDATQISPLSAQVNELLQKEPCSQLEDYQVRFVQLNKMLIQLYQVPCAKDLVVIIDEHIRHLEQAASTLHRSSTSPVQDSLWPLYARILSLPNLEPDLFRAAVATLHEKLCDAVSSDPLIKQLEDILPQFEAPAYFLWGEEAPFSKGLERLKAVKDTSLKLLHRLRQAPEGYVKKNFLDPLEKIFDIYSGFLRQFSEASSEKQKEMSIPRAQLSGPGLGFFSLDQKVAKTLMSRDKNGKECKKNTLGMHAVHCEQGVFYKPNSDHQKYCIHPEWEFAIYALYQRFGGYSVAQTVLAKMDHLFYAGHTQHQAHIFQAGYGVEGIPLHDLLDIANILPFLNTCLGSALAKKTFEWLLEENWQQEYLAEHPDLSPDKLAALSPGDRADRLFEAFQGLFNELPPAKRSLEFADGASLDATKKGLTAVPSSLLVGCLALLTRHSDLAVIATKDRQRFPSGLRSVSYEELITLQQSIKKIQIVYPGFSDKQLLEELPGLMERFDSANFSTHFLLTLLTNPRDHRSDNFMVTYTKNAQGGIQSLALVGIDNDQAFARYVGQVRTQLYLLDPMKKTFDSSVAQRFLAVTPEEFILDWLVALEEQNQSYLRWQKRGIKISQNEPLLDLPLKIELSLISSIHSKTLQLCQLLHNAKGVYPTHEELLKIQPELSRVYGKALKFGENPKMAYGDIERWFREERLFPIDEEPSVLLPIPQAVLKFLESLDLDQFSIKQKVSLLGKASHSFPSAATKLRIPGDPADPVS